MEEKLGFIGQRIPRKDGPEKVTGPAHYTVDIRLPGWIWRRVKSAFCRQGRLPFQRRFFYGACPPQAGCSVMNFRANLPFHRMMQGFAAFRKEIPTALHALFSKR